MFGFLGSSAYSKLEEAIVSIDIDKVKQLLKEYKSDEASLNSVKNGKSLFDIAFQANPPKPQIIQILLQNLDLHVIGHNNKSVFTHIAKINNKRYREQLFKIALQNHSFDHAILLNDPDFKSENLNLLLDCMSEKAKKKFIQKLIIKAINLHNLEKLENLLGASSYPLKKCINQEIVKLLITSILDGNQGLEFIIQKISGTQANYINQNGYSLLIATAEAGEDEIVKLLLEHNNIKLEQKIKNRENASLPGSTALKRAFINSHYNIAHMLIIKGAKLDFKIGISDDDLRKVYRTPLMIVLDEILDGWIDEPRIRVVESICARARKENELIQPEEMRELEVYLGEQINKLSAYDQPEKVTKAQLYIMSLILKYMQEVKYVAEHKIDISNIAPIIELALKSSGPLSPVASRTLSNLIDTNAIDLDQKLTTGNTLLIEAIKAYNSKLAKQIIKSQQANLDIQGRGNKNALQIVSELLKNANNEHKITLNAIQKALIKHDADINVKIERSNSWLYGPQKELLFENACNNDKYSVALRILKKVKPGDKSLEKKLGKSPLVFISKLSQYSEVVDKLIEISNDPSNANSNIITAKDYKDAIAGMFNNITSTLGDMHYLEKIKFLLSRYPQIKHKFEGQEGEQLLSKDDINKLFQLNLNGECKEIAQKILGILIENHNLDPNMEIGLGWLGLVKKPNFKSLFGVVLASKNKDNIQNLLNHPQFQINGIINIIASEHVSMGDFQYIIDLVKNHVDEEFWKKISSKLVENNQLEKLNSLLRKYDKIPQKDIDEVQNNPQYWIEKSEMNIFYKLLNNSDSSRDAKSALKYLLIHKKVNPNLKIDIQPKRFIGIVEEKNLIDVLFQVGDKQDIRNLVSHNDFESKNLINQITLNATTQEDFQDIINIVKGRTDENFWKEISSQLIKNNQSEKLSYLLNEKHIDHNLLTSLHLDPFKMMQENKLELLKTLIERKVLFGKEGKESFAEIRDKNSNSLLHLACKHKLTNFIKFLLSQEARYLDQYINDANNKGFTPFMLFCSHKSNNNEYLKEVFENFTNNSRFSFSKEDFQAEKEDKGYNHELIAYTAGNIDLAIEILKEKRFHKTSVKRLFEALSLDGKIDYIENLIEEYPDHYAHNHHIMRILLTKGYYDELQRLIDNPKTDINKLVYEDKNLNKSMLQFAFEHYTNAQVEDKEKIKDIIFKVLSKGANINITTLGKNQKDITVGESLLSLVARGGYDEILNELLKHPELDLNFGGFSMYNKNPKLKEPIIAAYEAGQFEIVNKLLEHEIDLESKIQNKELSEEQILKINPQHRLNPNIKTFDGLLLPFKLYLDSTSSQDINGKNTKREILEKLICIPGYDPNAKNELGNTLFMQACMRGDQALAYKIYISSNGLEPGAKNDLGQTALMLAAASDQSALIGFFSKFKSVREHFNINDVDEVGNTALLYAYANGNEKMIDTLVSMGAEPTLTNRFNGRTCFMSLCSSGNYNLFERFLNENEVHINHKDKFKNTALHFAASNASKKEHLKIFEEIINRGADINAQNSEGITPLMIAVANNDIEKVKLLIDKGANINLKDKDGNTAFITACAGQNKDMIEFLIKNTELDINAKNNYGCNAFMVTALQAQLKIKSATGQVIEIENQNTNQRWRGDHEILGLLIDYGAEPTFIDKVEGLGKRLLKGVLVAEVANLANGIIFSHNPILQRAGRIIIETKFAYNVYDSVSTQVKEIISNFINKGTNRDLKVELGGKIMVGVYSINSWGKVIYGDNLKSKLNEKANEREYNHGEGNPPPIFSANDIGNAMDSGKALNDHNLLCHRYILIQNKLNNNMLMPWTRRALNRVKAEIIDADNKLLVGAKKVEEGKTFQEKFENILMVYLQEKNHDQVIKAIISNKIGDDTLNNLSQILGAINNDEIIVSPDVKYLAYRFHKRFKELEAQPVSQPSLISRIYARIFGENTNQIQLPDNSMEYIEQLKQNKVSVDSRYSAWQRESSKRSLPSQQQTFMEWIVQGVAKMYGTSADQFVDKVSSIGGNIAGAVAGSGAGVGISSVLDVGDIHTGPFVLLASVLSTTISLVPSLIMPTIIGAGVYGICTALTTTEPQEEVDEQLKEYDTRQKIQDLKKSISSEVSVSNHISDIKSSEVELTRAREVNYRRL